MGCVCQHAGTFDLPSLHQTIGLALSQAEPQPSGTLEVHQRPRPGKNFGGLLALFAFLLPAVFMLIGCREQDAGWDQDIAVKVNGRPITRAALERVLEWGFQPDLDQGGEREVNIPLILDKIINEELILDEAQKAGLVLSAAEVDDELGQFDSAWFGNDSPRPERAEFRQALARHLLLRKMTEKVINEKKVLSADKWHEFWEKWPRNKSLAFRVKALLLPPQDDEPKWPAEVETLDQLADHFRNEGQAVLVSRPLWLSSNNLDQAMIEELNRAYRERRLSLPARLEESWAVYELMSIYSGPEAADEFDLARKAFEARAGEEAFQKWLAEIRSSAKIEYSPSFGFTAALPQ